MSEQKRHIKMYYTGPVFPDSEYMPPTVYGYVARKVKGGFHQVSVPSDAVKAELSRKNGIPLISEKEYKLIVEDSEISDEQGDADDSGGASDE